MAQTPRPIADRSDVPERRRRLRALDVALGEELEDAGALTFGEFCKHVGARRLLGGAAEDATLWEWWHFAQRRQLIARREIDAGEDQYGLTAEGRAQLSGRRVADTTLIMPTLARVARAAAKEPPLALTIALVALVSSSPSGTSWVLFLATIAVLVFVVGSVADRFVARHLDTLVDRTVLAVHVAWLEGREVRRPLSMKNLPAVDRASVVPLPGPPLPLLPPRDHEGL